MQGGGLGGNPPEKKSQVAIDLENMFKQLQKQKSTGSTAGGASLGAPVQKKASFTSKDLAEGNGEDQRRLGKGHRHSSDEEDGGIDFFKTGNNGGNYNQSRKQAPPMNNQIPDFQSSMMQSGVPSFINQNVVNTPMPPPPPSDFTASTTMAPTTQQPQILKDKLQGLFRAKPNQGNPGNTNNSNQM